MAGHQSPGLKTITGEYLPHGPATIVLIHPATGLQIIEENSQEVGQMIIREPSLLLGLRIIPHGDHIVGQLDILAGFLQPTQRTIGTHHPEIGRLIILTGEHRAGQETMIIKTRLVGQKTTLIGCLIAGQEIIPLRFPVPGLIRLTIPEMYQKHGHQGIHLQFHQHGLQTILENVLGPGLLITALEFPQPGQRITAVFHL